MSAYWGLHSNNATSSTSGSNLEFLTLFFIRTGPGEVSHDGKVVPDSDRLLNEKNLSCGVALVAVHSREHIECSACGRICSQLLSGRFWDLRARVTAFHKVPLVSPLDHCLVGCRELFC